jgi:hypothetical protein
MKREMCVRIRKQILRQRHRTVRMAQPNPAANTSLETPLPSPQVLVQAARIAQQLDRPIQLDYYADTCTDKAVIGEDQDTKDKILIKSNEEYTSLIQKIYKAGNPGNEDFLVLTENSIYIVSGKIKKRKIQTSSLVAHD